MNTLLNHFNNALKRQGKQCVVNNKDTDIVTGLFKEIDNKNSIDTKYFMTLDNLNQGDIITYNNINYIVNTKNDNINNAYNIYEVEKSHMSFNLAVNSVLYNQIGIQYVSNLGFMNGQIVIAEGKSSLKVQSNSITNQVTINTRFIKNGQVWKITGINKSMEGLILFNCDLDQIGAGDDIANEIPSGTHFPVTNVNVTPNPISINTSDTQQLTVTVDVEGTPVENPTLIYSSNNTSIATVSDSGLVEGITEGNCNIVVTYTNSDGNNTINNVECAVSTPVSKTFLVTAPTDYDSKIASHGAYEIFAGDPAKQFTFYAMQGETQLLDTFTLSWSYQGDEFDVTNITGNGFQVTSNYVYFDDFVYVTCTDDEDGSLVGTIALDIKGAW